MIFDPFSTARSRLCLACLVAALASACGGSGPGQTTVEAPAAMRAVHGQVAKGPLDGATVRAFPVDARGTTTGAAVAETTTDVNGRWLLALPAGGEAYAIVSSGGRYIDEADPEPDPALRRSVTLAAGDSFAALLPPAATSVAINAYTDALLRKSRFETEGDNFFDVFATNRGFVSRALGFDVVTTLPADPVQPAPGTTLAQRHYAMALGGVANVVNDYALANARTIADFEIIDAVIDDLTDCTIDGRGIGGPIASGVVSVDADLNAQILRFRNNNFAAYAGTPVLSVDQAECARSGRQADVIAPVFTIVPGDFTVGAVDADGIAASAPAVQSVLATARAVDDRDGDVTPVAILPDQLPLGDTVVVLRVSDAAGNTVETSLVVSVADLEAPQITAPAAVDVMASGALTVVALGTPTVSDNVTPAAELLVTNDAPDVGFPAGVHTVTWEVRDAAGLVATATQTVTVRTAPPVVVTPLPDLAAVEGEPFSAALTGGFADPDSVLGFALTGLPAGTGLSFDAASGVLAGVPSDADAQASPLLLTVTAFDEADAVADSFTLSVTDVNNPPSFTVVDAVTLEEDFAGPVFVDVVPDPVTVGDPNDVVYTLDTDSADFVDLAIDSDSGRVMLTALANANGTGTFTITADDGAAVNNRYSRDVNVTVTAVNDPPVFALSGDVEVVPGFSGTARVEAIPAAVPADEADQTVSYGIEHSIVFATITVDAASGTVSIGDVANVEAAGLVAVTADDGQAVANTHTEILSFVVRESDKIVYVAEPVDDPFPIRPVFPTPDEVPVGFSARNLPESLRVHPATGRLTGTPTERDGETGVVPVMLTITGSLGTVADLPLVLRIADRDTDADGLPDRLEADYGTDALRADSDDDGLGDGVEVEVGSDPLAPLTRLTRLTPDELSAGDALEISGTGSAASPVVIALAPGVYATPLRLAAPCEHVVVLGGVDADVLYPQASARTVLSASDGAIIGVEGCVDVRIHHLSLTAAPDVALQVRDAVLGGSDIAVYDNRAGVMTLARGRVALRDSVFSGNRGDTTSGALVRVGADSELYLRRDIVRHDGSAAVFDVDDTALVELENLRGQARYTGAGRVSKTRSSWHPVRHVPDNVSIARRDGRYVATLHYLGLHLGSGYDVRVNDGAVALQVDDINHGEYLIHTDSLRAEDITVLVDGTTVPFVIELP